jgi:predicted DNA-binding protein (MmcQ/YjbR family)
MRLEAFDVLCAALPGATLSIQWGERHVYKVGGKVFAMGGEPSPAGEASFIFKTSPVAFEVLIEAARARRAPYLPRGNWLEVKGETMGEEELAGYIRQAHGIVAGHLPKALRPAGAWAFPERTGPAR